MLVRFWIWRRDCEYPQPCVAGVHRPAKAPLIAAQARHYWRSRRQVHTCTCDKDYQGKNCKTPVVKPRATCESAKSWLCEGSAEINLPPASQVHVCAKEECQLDVDSARCCVKNALCRTMRCPSGYLARDGAEMFSCQAGHCTVEADLETCCAQDLCANVRCENGGTCTSTDGSCKCAEVSRGTCAINVDECKEIRVGVTACALIAWVSTGSVLAMQDTAERL